MGTLSYAKTVTPDSSVIDCPGTGRIYHNVVKYDSDGDSITYEGTLALETECGIFEPDQVKVTIASAKAYFNGTVKVNQSSSTTLNDTGSIGATKTLGTYKVTVSKAHTEKTVTYKLTAGTLTVYVKDGSYSKTGTNSCGTKSGTLTIAAKTSYTVSYSANSGSGAPSSQTKWYGEALTLSATKPTRTGYTFAGWKCSANNVIYQAGASLPSSINTSCTMTAQWTVNSYTLTYNGNGGTTPAAVKRNYGAAYGTLPSSTLIGYNLNGWWTTAGGGTQVTSATTMGAANTTIYAHWIEKIDMLTYNNGGHGTAPSSELMYYTTQTTAASAISASGWIFQGWKRSDDNTVIQPGAVVKAAKVIPTALTLTAQWIPDICEITLDEDSATTSGTLEFWSKYGQGFYSDEECTDLITEIECPLKNHYTFNGYYKDENIYINSTGLILPICGEVTTATALIADWIPDIYTITLNNQGATSSGTIEYYEKYGVGTYEDENCTILMNIIVPPQKTGYTFNGYYQEGQGIQYIDENGLINQNTIGINSTIYASWTINTHNLIFNANGGEINGSLNPLNKPLNYNEQYSERYGDFPEPTRAGYHFDGWYATISGEDSPQTDFVMQDRDYVLYARWSANTYTDEDDYIYTTIVTGEVAVKVKENSNYSTIPYSITKDNEELIITSLEECFKDDENVSGNIFVNCSAVTNIDGIFDGVSNDICIVFGSDFEEFSEVWDTINNTYENVTYLGANDTDYFYTANENDTTDKNLNIRVKDKTKEMYGLPFLEIENGNDTWTSATMNKCYQGCQQLQGVLPVHNNPSSAVDIFEDIGEDTTIYLLCLEPNALTTWQNIANNWQ